MVSLLWALFGVVLGCLLIYRFSDFALVRPRWAARLLMFGAGTAVGIGLTSSLFFLSQLVIPGAPGLSMWIEIAALAWVCYEVFRRNKPAVKNKPAVADIAIRPFPLNLLLMGALILAVTVVTSTMTIAWDLNPHGNWDAWSIWNLRARFLVAGGDLAQRAWSPMVRSTHPEYPLLVSGFVARCWVYSHSLSTAVPIATSYLFLLALLALATGGMATLRSRSLGLLLALVLLGTTTVLHEVPAQYADIPLGCYLMGALLLTLLDRPVLAGAFAGLAAWTKDEGLLFLIAFLAAAIIFRRRQVLLLVAGALPFSAFTLVFKAVIASGTSSLLGGSVPGLLHRLGDTSRYRRVIGAFAGEFAGMNSGWYHPVLPVLLLTLVLRFDREHRRDSLFCGGIFLSQILGYFAVYIITANDLTWQLQTSLNRLFVQLWPSLLLAVFVGLRVPESTAVVPATTPLKSVKAGRKARG